MFTVVFILGFFFLFFTWPKEFIFVLREKKSFQPLVFTLLFTFLLLLNWMGLAEHCCGVAVFLLGSLIISFFFFYCLGWLPICAFDGKNVIQRKSDSNVIRKKIQHHLTSWWTVEPVVLSCNGTRGPRPHPTCCALPAANVLSKAQAVVKQCFSFSFFFVQSLKLLFEMKHEIVN